jgi:hypothetical protein
LRAANRPGANERIGIGAIGVGSRASLLLEQLPDGGRIVALCDCNLSRAEAFKAGHKASWPVLRDYRSLLERKDVDAVIVATGEFQRLLPAMNACLAGKDVYAEKPLTLYIQEGRALVEMVRRCGRVLPRGRKTAMGPRQRALPCRRRCQPLPHAAPPTGLRIADKIGKVSGTVAEFVDHRPTDFTLMEALPRPWLALRASLARVRAK